MVPFKGGFDIYMQKKDTWGQNWTFFSKEVFRKKLKHFQPLRFLAIEGLLLLFWDGLLDD